MSSFYPDWGQAARKNQAYERDYGQDKSVNSPVWAGSEGDRVALQRSAYPSKNAYNYFNGPVYNQQYRNLLTTGLQGRGKTIHDRYQLTGMADYSTYGREEREYTPVSMGGLDSMDMMVGAAILGGALIFIVLSR